eukprot:scaffold10075_cov12-Tisochrysis_lutea.AAC.1
MASHQGHSTSTLTRSVVEEKMGEGTGRGRGAGLGFFSPLGGRLNLHPKSVCQTLCCSELQHTGMAASVLLGCNTRP